MSESAVALPENAIEIDRNRIRFKHTGPEWSGLHSAEKWLEDNGFSVGPMQRGEPIGFVQGRFGVPKWLSLNLSERDQLDGDIRPDGMLFRHSDAIVWFYDKTEMWWDGGNYVA